MRLTHFWPGPWSRVTPQVSDHPEGGAELVWAVRGHPFNRPVIARSNVGVHRDHGRFVRVELMADGFHGQQASDYGWFRDLEWAGPILLPHNES